MKSILSHGIAAGLTAAILSIVYAELYSYLFFISFDEVVNNTSIVSACLIACVLMALSYLGLQKINKPQLKGVLNLVIMLGSFASILAPITMSLPLDIDFPELFPGLVIPMHFFPAMSFFGLQAFFKKL